MSFKILFSISCLLIFFGETLYAQSSIGATIAATDFQAKRVIPPSPEAAELGRYGNVPVSLFAGTAQVSVPLFDAKVGNVILPINLSYNASGFKPEELASWVGLNWSLNAGGVITRAVIGNPDVVPYYFSSTNQYQDLFASTDLIGKSDALLKIKQGYLETQPDIYYYNFGGYSGKFIIKPDGTVIKKERDNLLIQHCISCFNSQTDGSATFTITDASGTVFRFETTENSFTQYDPGNVSSTSGPEPGILGYTFPSTWYLTSVTPAATSAQHMDFEYYTTINEHTLFHNYLDYHSITYSAGNDPQAIITGTDPDILYNGGPCATYQCSTPDAGVWNIDQFSYGSTPTVTMKRKYLKNIKIYSGVNLVNRIDFLSAENQRQDLDHLYYPGERMLTAIKLYYIKADSTDLLVKHFSFHQSYFTGAVDIPDYKRLRLDGITELAIDGASNVKPPYQFDYNAGANGLTPAITSAGKDHWGFYNGQNNVTGIGTTLIPTVSPGFGLGAIRDPNFEGSVTNMLTKLTYPTGGYTTFEYELNDMKGEGVLPLMVGGIRVKKIIDYSFSAQKAVQKEYSYVDNEGKSSGAANFPIYSSTSSFSHTGQPSFVSCIPASCSQSADWIKNYFTITASPVFGLGYMQGSHIQYGQVTERQTDVNSGLSLGKSVYQYQVTLNANGDDDISAGDLLQKTDYDINLKKVKEVVNIYNYLPFNSWVAAAVKSSPLQSNKTVLCQSTVNGQVAYQWYGTWQNFSGCAQQRVINNRLDLFGYFFSGREKQLAQQDETVYDQLSNNYITSTRKFTYGNPAHTFPTLIEEYTSGGEVVGTVKKYAADYIIPGAQSLSDQLLGLKLLKDKNILGAEVESVQYRKNQDGSNLRYLNGTLTTYNPVTPFPDKMYKLELSVPASSLQLSSISNTTFSYAQFYRQVARFKYDSYGNLIEQSKTPGAPKAYVWDEVNSLPVAEVYNADAQSTAYTSFETYQANGGWAIGNQTPSLFVLGGLTGITALNLSSQTDLYKHNLNPAKQFIVSYWCKNGVVSVLGDAGPAVSKSLSSTVGSEAWNSRDLKSRPH